MKITRKKNHCARKTWERKKDLKISAKYFSKHLLQQQKFLLCKQRFFVFKLNECEFYAKCSPFYNVVYCRVIGDTSSSWGRESNYLLI
jgi:hypothetical protein